MINRKIFVNRAPDYVYMHTLQAQALGHFIIR